MTALPSFHLPRFVALCGNPKSGKSTAQEILKEDFGYEPVDDGFVLREFAVNKLGLDWDDVLTQEGKIRSTEILGHTWQNRILLGELGKVLEGMFGGNIMPFIATRGLDPAKRYSFGSVRRDQGFFYRALGGAVIELTNPLAPPTGNDFDTYDDRPVQITIHNDGLQTFDGDKRLARLDLAAKLKDAIGRLTEVRR
jgi:hypothetical protein